MKLYIKNSDEVVSATEITASSSFEDDIKVELFDYLANYGSLYVEGDYPALKYVERVKALAPAYTINDVLDYAFEEGESLVAALEHFEELV